MSTRLYTVHTNTPQEDVARVVGRYNLLAVPVINDTDGLVGIVTIDDVIDVIGEENTEDMLKMAGNRGRRYRIQIHFQKYSYALAVVARKFCRWLGCCVSDRYDLRGN